MADAHEKKALLGLCNAHCLRLSTPSRARSAPCSSAAWPALSRLSAPYPLLVLSEVFFFYATEASDDIPL